MLNKAEAYFTKEFKEKTIILVVLTLLLLIPAYSWRLFFLFLLITTLLPKDVHNGRIEIMMSLPFSKTDIFWMSYALLLTIAVITQAIGGALFNISFAEIMREILATLIFSSAYFGITMVSVSVGFGNFGVPFLALIMDSFFGAIGKSWHFRYDFLASPMGSNPYTFISPVYQGNTLAALIFAVILLYLGYLTFSGKEISK